MKIEKNNDYKNLTKKHSPRSPLLKDCLTAALSGGSLCFVGQWLAFLFIWLGLSEKYAYIAVTLFFIAAASLSTALGFFDKLGKRCGAGTLVPVTGFANAVTSAAIDNRSEGFVLGVGAKIFTVAGPVILFSTLAGTLYGIFYYIYTLVA